MRCIKSEDFETSIILVGNKADLDDKRQITTEEGQSVAQVYGLDFLEMSALSEESVTRAFEVLITKMIENKTKAPTRPGKVANLLSKIF